MARNDEPKREVGLKAVREAREERAVRKHGRITGKVWVAAAAAMVTAVIAAVLVRDRSLSGEKEQLLAQRRAAVATVGKEWTPLRDNIEAITTQAAGTYQGDQIDPDASKWDFRSVPGIYLRLRVADAKDVTSIRKQARDSLKDAFTGCLLREPNLALTRGEPDASSAPEQPWNLRQAYAATRILTDEWAEEVKDATDKLRLHVFEQQYEKAQREEIPLAIDIIKKAQFFLLVLDEDVPEAKEYATEGKAETEEALQQVAHPTRVVIMNLRANKVLARLRRTADAEIRLAGGASVTDPEVRAAMRRQVNNCALANDVWAAIKPAADKPAADKPAADAPAKKD